MKELDTKEMDNQELELYSMLRSKFNDEEMERLAKLMVVDAEKYHQEKLNNNIALGDVSGSFIVTDLTDDEIMMDEDVCAKCFFNGDCQSIVFEHCNAKLKQTQYYR